MVTSPASRSAKISRTVCASRGRSIGIADLLRPCLLPRGPARHAGSRDQRACRAPHADGVVPYSEYTRRPRRCRQRVAYAGTARRGHTAAAEAEDEDENMKHARQHLSQQRDKEIVFCAMPQRCTLFLKASLGLRYHCCRIWLLQNTIIAVTIGSTADFESRPGYCHACYTGFAGAIGRCAYCYN